MSHANFKKQETSNEFINSVTKDTLVTTLEQSKEDAILTINQLKIEMINRHLLSSDFDTATKEVLLEPSRVTAKYSKGV